MKYKGCHRKEVMWKKPDHLLEMVNKFKQERESQTCNEEKLKNKYPPTNGLSVDEGINPF